MAPLDPKLVSEISGFLKVTEVLSALVAGTGPVPWPAVIILVISITCYDTFESLKSVSAALGLILAAWYVCIHFGHTSSKSEGVPGDKSKHQGSYGKVKVYKHGKLATLLRPSELLAALRYKLGSKQPAGMLCEGAPESMDIHDIMFCESILVAVSRSFAVVIRDLPPLLRLPVAVFYLVLRALDTVEDEMDLSRFEPYSSEAITSYETKLDLLVTFHDKLGEKSWTLSGIGEADERRLLEHFDIVLRVFRNLPSSHQDIISDITKRMASGMRDFAGRDLAAGTKDRADLDLYCHHVAGLVGIGLSEQFVASGLENSNLKSRKSIDLANSMGLFLQKTNIIRDYLEDLLDGRSFWPKDVVTLYAESLEQLRTGGEKSIACMNHLITDAMINGQDSLAYLELLQDPLVFKFCAVPQVMAMATLVELYSNPNVFTHVVKIRKGLSAMILQDCGDMATVRRWFSKFASQIVKRIDPTDPNAERTCAAAKALGAK